MGWWMRVDDGMVCEKGDMVRKRGGGRILHCATYVAICTSTAAVVARGICTCNILAIVCIMPAMSPVVKALRAQRRSEECMIFNTTLTTAIKHTKRIGAVVNKTEKKAGICI